MSNTRRPWAIAAAAALAAATMLSGCGSTGGDAAKTATDNIISIAASEPQNPLVPGNTLETGGGQVNDVLFSGLVGFKADGTAVNEVADKITPNADNTKFDVTLKSGWKFTDGTPVTSESFTKAWSYTANLKNGQLCASYLAMIKGYDDLQKDGLKGDEQLSGLTVTDDTHFSVELNESSAVFPVILGYSGYYPLPESFYKDPKAFGESPVSDGPYKFKSWKHNADIVLEKNPDYNGNFKAKNDGLDFKIYTSADSSYADVQSGNLDVSANIPPSALKSFQKNTKMNNYSKAGSGTATFTIPQSLEHFGGEEGVLRRQAISMAIDRKQITEKVLNNTATPAKEFSSPMTSGYSDSLKGNENLTFDASKAKELWAKADAISKFTGTFTLSYNADGDAKSLYDAMANQLKNNLGIDAATNPVPTFQEFRDEVTKRQLKGGVKGGWQADYPTIENYLAPIYATSAADGHGANDGDYKNPKFDALLDEAAKASSVDEANKYYQQAEEILLNDLPGIPLYNSNAYAVFGKNVKHAEPNWNGVPVFHELTKQ